MSSLQQGIRFILRLLPLGILVCIVLEIVISNDLVLLGQGVQRLDGEREKLVRENEVLAQQVAEHSSMVTIEHNAKELGFVRPKEIITIRPNSMAVALQTLK